VPSAPAAARPATFGGVAVFLVGPEGISPSPYTCKHTYLFLRFFFRLTIFSIFFVETSLPLFFFFLNLHIIFLFLFSISFCTGTYHYRGPSLDSSQTWLDALTPRHGATIDAAASAPAGAATTAGEGAVSGDASGDGDEGEVIPFLDPPMAVAAKQEVTFHEWGFG
jgi:hypothetical protein